MLSLLLCRCFHEVVLVGVYSLTGDDGHNDNRKALHYIQITSTSNQGWTADNTAHASLPAIFLVPADSLTTTTFTPPLAPNNAATHYGYGHLQETHLFLPDRGLDGFIFKIKHANHTKETDIADGYTFLEIKGILFRVVIGTTFQEHNLKDCVHV